MAKRRRRYEFVVQIHNLHQKWVSFFPPDCKSGAFIRGVGWREVRILGGSPLMPYFNDRMPPSCGVGRGLVPLGVAKTSVIKNNTFNNIAWKQV